MKNLKSLLNILIIFEVIIQCIVIIFDISHKSYPDAILHLIEAIIICIPLFIIGYIADAILKLQTEHKSLERNLNSELNRISRSTVQNIYKAEKLQGRRVKVLGKRTYNESVGFDCPLCGFSNKADCTRCKGCDATIEYER